MPDQGSLRASSSLLPARKEGLSPPDSFSWLCRAAPDLAFLLIALLFLGIFHIVSFPHSQTTVALTCFDLSATEHLQPFIFLLWAQLDKSCLTLVWLAKNTSGYFCGVSILGRRQSWQQAHAYSWAVGCATALPCFWLAAFCWIHTRAGRRHGILALGDCVWHRPAQLGTNPGTWPARLSHHLERHWSWGKLSINPRAKHGVCSAPGCLVTAKFHDKNTPAGTAPASTPGWLTSHGLLPAIPSLHYLYLQEGKCLLPSEQFCPSSWWCHVLWRTGKHFTSLLLAPASTGWSWPGLWWTAGKSTPASQEGCAIILIWVYFPGGH